MRETAVRPDAGHPAPVRRPAAAVHRRRSARRVRRGTRSAGGETVTHPTPEPGSPWARYCPDAWPREWLGPAGELPPGFSRPAEPLEADLITRRLTEAGFLTA